MRNGFINVSRLTSSSDSDIVMAEVSGVGLFICLIISYFSKVALDIMVFNCQFRYNSLVVY